MSQRVLILIALLLCLVARPASSVAEQAWILVDTAASTLRLMQGDALKVQFDDIAIGQAGASSHRVRDDRQTPLGAYRVVEIREQSRFYRFIALDYPNLGDAQHALRTGLIDEVDYQRIRRAHENGKQPPIDTPLGGDIGIHGIGEGDLRFHEDYNWTDGCVALTNGQIDVLLPLITLGMTVVIR